MELKNIIEAALFAADRSLSVNQLQNLFGESERPLKEDIQKAIDEISEDYRSRPIQLQEVASGFRFQVKKELSPWISQLFAERPPKYSKALLETLAIIAYRQPATRGEIEAIRGVTVSSNIMRTLKERQWIRIVGHKEVPGRPALYSTTKQFLDYFNLKSLSELPSLKEMVEQAELTEGFSSADGLTHQHQSVDETTSSSA